MAGVAVALLVGSAVSRLGAADSVDSDTRSLVLAPDAPPPAPVDPAQTVSQFLDAEVRRDSETAFNLLSDSDRARYGSAATWSDRRASSLGLVTDWGWQSQDSAGTGSTGEFVTEVVLEPGLSAVDGWSAASATMTWTLVEELGWRIVLSETAVEPEFAPLTAAGPAAQNWLDGGCVEDLDPRVRPLGTNRELSEQLCAAGVQVAGVAENLGPRLSAELSLKYGPDSGLWARTVRTDSEDNALLILAPIGSEWMVIDAVLPR